MKLVLILFEWNSFFCETQVQHSSYSPGTTFLFLNWKFNSSYYLKIWGPCKEIWLHRFTPDQKKSFSGALTNGKLTRISVLNAETSILTKNHFPSLYISVLIKVIFLNPPYIFEYQILNDHFYHQNFKWMTWTSFKSF